LIDKQAVVPEPAAVTPAWRLNIAMQPIDTEMTA